MNTIIEESDEVQEIVDQLLLSSASEDNVPQCILSGSGYGWFWNPQTRQMARALRGSEIVLLSEYDCEKSLVMSHGLILVVNNDEVIEVGYN
tara:strand:- start:1522 stop:1797 length:276 start_codon:yes stop_codon:yes gene_type:complete